MTMLGVSVEELDPFRQRQALIDAAQAGDARAQSRLGGVYRIGDEFTAQDFAEARLLSLMPLQRPEGSP